MTDSYDSLELGDLNMTIGEKVASVSAETSAIKTKVNQASVTAQIAADGTHNIFRTDDETEPIAKKVGDLWYKIDGEYTSMYQWDGKAWVLIVNTRDTADVRAELGQAKSDMAQAKTDAQNAYDEAIKATNTANGAKAQTTEALKQVKQANDSYTTLAKEVAGNKANADADYKRVSDSYTALSKEVADNKANADADYQKAQSGIAQAKTDAQTAYDEAIKATNTANGAKAQTDEALKQAKQANDSYTTLAKEVAGNKASTDADYQKAQAAIAQAQKDLSGMTGAVAEVKKGQGELSAKVAGKVDNTVYQTYVTQTNQALSEKLVASDLNGYAKTVDVTKSIDGVKTTVADNTGKITTMQTDINGVKSTVKSAQGDISALQTDAKSIKATVSDHTGKITQLTTDVDGVKSTVSSKVDKTTYQSYVAQTDKALSAKLTASDLQGYAKTADVKQTTDGLSASITKVQGDLNGLQIGGANLLDNTAGPWKQAGIGKDYADTVGFVLNKQPQSTTITVSFDCRASASKDFYCFFYGSDYNANGGVTSACNSQGWVNTSIAMDGMVPITPSTTWERVWIRYNLSKIPPAGTKRILIGRLYSNYATSDWLEIRNIKLESGGKATD